MRGEPAMGLAILFIAMRAILLPGFAAAQQPPEATSADLFAAFQWGEVTDGFQLRVSTGKNTESLTETESILYLGRVGEEGGPGNPGTLEQGAGVPGKHAGN
jgi:hypothetical protein